MLKTYQMPKTRLRCSQFFQPVANLGRLLMFGLWILIVIAFSIQLSPAQAQTPKACLNVVDSQPNGSKISLKTPLQQRYRQLSRSIRHQIADGVKHEKIQVDLELVQPELTATLNALQKKLHELPAQSRFQNGAPNGADQVLAKMVIDQIIHLQKSAEVNYLQVMETLWVSAYIFATDAKGVARETFGFEFSISKPTDKYFRWNLQSLSREKDTQSPNPTMLGRWKSLKGLIPIYTTSKISKATFQKLWSRGIALIGLSFETMVHYDQITGSAFRYLEHDWAHALEINLKYSQANYWEYLKAKFKGTPYKEFYKLYLTLERKILKSHLSEREKETAFDILFQMSHEIYEIYLKTGMIGLSTLTDSENLRFHLDRMLKEARKIETVPTDSPSYYSKIRSFDNSFGTHPAESIAPLTFLLENLNPQ